MIVQLRSRQNDSRPYHAPDFDVEVHSSGGNIRVTFDYKDKRFKRGAELKMSKGAARRLAEALLAASGDNTKATIKYSVEGEVQC